MSSWAGGWAGVIFIFSFYYMFQSILNTFVLGLFFGREKLIIFMDRGTPPPRGKFQENNYSFKPFLNPILTKTMKIYQKLEFFMQWEWENWNC